MYHEPPRKPHPVALLFISPPLYPGQSVLVALPSLDNTPVPLLPINALPVEFPTVTGRFHKFPLNSIIPHYEAPACVCVDDDVAKLPTLTGPLIPPLVKLLAVEGVSISLLVPEVLPENAVAFTRVELIPNAYSLAVPVSKLLGPLAAFSYSNSVNGRNPAHAA